jgi:hypothetical protein
MAMDVEFVTVAVFCFVDSIVAVIFFVDSELLALGWILLKYYKLNR